MIIYIVLGCICAGLSWVLAEVKGKSNPFLWMILGGFFMVVPIIALAALHSPEEIQALLEKKKEP